MPVTQQYWRILVNGPTNGASVVALAEVAFLDTNNVAIPTSGGTFTALSSFNSSFLPANAFDGNPATAWASLSSPSFVSPQWIQVQFTGAVPVVAVAISIRNDISPTSQSPPTFLIQSSPDGTTWTTQNTVTGFNWTSTGQKAYFTASTVVGNARITQLPIEVSSVPSPHVRTSQVGLEVALNAVPHVKASQVAVEALINAAPHLKVSQLCLEVVYPYIPSPGPVAIQNFLLP